MTDLADICLLITDGKHGDCQDKAGSGYYFISCKDVKDGWVDYLGARQITEADYRETHKRTKLQPNDILITNSGTIGRMALVPDRDETYRTTFQKSVAIIKPNQNEVIPQWLYYCLRANKDALIAWAGGTAQKNLLLRDLRAFEIQLTPLSNQQKIAAILSAYDDLIENNTRRIRILEEMAQMIYREWFVSFRFPGHEKVRLVEAELGVIPEGWEVTDLGKLADFVRGIEAGSRNYHETPAEERVPFLRVGDLSNRSSHIFIDGYRAKDRVLAKEDIAVTLDGSVGIVRIGLFGAYSSGIRKVLPRDRNVTGWAHLYCLLNSECIQSIIQAHARGTTIQHAGSAVDHMRFALAPPSIITQFENCVAPVLKQVLTLSRQIDVLHKSRDLLLTRLISGEIDVENLDIDTGPST